MPRIEWDGTGDRRFESGVEKMVLFPMGTNGAYEHGVPWNGITAVTESPAGADVSDLYADDIKYASLRAAETFGATIEAYTYPDAWAECDGSAQPVPGLKIGQQSRKAFGFCYRTALGSDTQTDLTKDYLLHIVYNCTASPSERAYATINDSPDAITFSWEVSSTPVNVTGYKATSILTIDSTKFKEDALKAKLTALENSLYGTNADEAAGIADSQSTLLSPDQVIALLSSSEEDD